MSRYKFKVLSASQSGYLPDELIDSAMASGLGFSVVRSDMRSAAFKCGLKVLKYLYDDISAKYGLASDVAVSISGDGVDSIFRNSPSFESADGYFGMRVAAGGAVRLVVRAFDSSLRLWNGPNVIPNNKFRSMLASLFHDFIWEKYAEIAKALGVSPKEVLKWGDGVLYSVWVFASNDSRLGRIEAYVAFQVCESAAGWFPVVAGVLRKIGLAAAVCTLFSGCFTPPRWHVDSIEGEDAVRDAMENGGSGVDAGRIPL